MSGMNECVIELTYLIENGITKISLDGKGFNSSFLPSYTNSKVPLTLSIFHTPVSGVYTSPSFTLPGIMLNLASTTSSFIFIILISFLNSCSTVSQFV